MARKLMNLLKDLHKKPLENIKASRKTDSVAIAVTEEIQQYSTDKKGKVR